MCTLPAPSLLQRALFAEAAPAKPAIYSEQALIGFSALLNPVVGGLLAYSSLRATGRRAAAWYALSLSVYFALFTLAVSRNISYGGVFSIGLGYVWGRWLGQYVRRKLPGAADYPRRSVVTPLLLCLALVAVVLAGGWWARQH